MTLTADEALRWIFGEVACLDTEEVALPEALGRVLAEEIAAASDHPPWDNSAMDGFAVRWEDVRDASPDRPAALTVIEVIPAGRMPARPVGPGQASRIMTGAPLPEGSDTVIPIEDTVAEGPARVRVRNAEGAGSYLRRRGGDLARGTKILSSGTVVRPPQIGMLALLDRAGVKVYRRPRVAIVATGDELVPPGSERPERSPGQIPDVSSASLTALVTTAGGLPRPLGIVPDRKEAIRDRVAAARAEADLIVVAAGASVGDYDLTRDVLEEMGAKVRFTRLAIRPGRPCVFARLGETPFFGLPGNPVSAFVTFQQLVRPAIWKMGGRRELRPRLEPAVLEEELPGDPEKKLYLRGILRREGDRMTVRSTGPQGSGIFTSIARANCFIHLPPGADKVSAGEIVDVEPFFEEG